MLSAEFYYPINDVMTKVVASCKEVVHEDVFGLSIAFYDKEDNLMRVEYDAEMFEDLECEALAMLAEVYYNGELGYIQR